MIVIKVCVCVCVCRLSLCLCVYLGEWCVLAHWVFWTDLGYTRAIHCLQNLADGVLKLSFVWLWSRWKMPDLWQFMRKMRYLKEMLNQLHHSEQCKMSSIRWPFCGCECICNMSCCTCRLRWETRCRLGRRYKISSELYTLYSLGGWYCVTFHIISSYQRPDVGVGDLGDARWAVSCKQCSLGLCGCVTFHIMLVDYNQRKKMTYLISSVLCDWAVFPLWSRTVCSVRDAR